MRKILTEILPIDYPILVAPMFLISNVNMVVAALEFGVTAAFPAMNYRTDRELREAIDTIRQRTKKPFGVNLIVNRSNPKYKEQLKTLVEKKVDFIITSLGSPEETIACAKPAGIKVFCDVTDVHYAQKVEKLGADALIAVNNRAGGHCGSMDRELLLQSLREQTHLPIISAGGVGTGKDIKEAMELGASGVSVGTLFLASSEAEISDEYRKALIEYGEKDIVLTTKLSGSPLTVINTPYVRQVGAKASFLERWMNRHKWLKKHLKMLIAYRGMKRVEKAAFKATYKTFWCAGPAIEQIHSIRPMQKILEELIQGLDNCK